MIASEQSMQLALRNVAYWGDTDVLPFPIENHWFHDDEPRVLSVLRDIDEHFDSWLQTYPLLRDRVLANVGYVGYRSVAQVDAVWNAYLLALVIEVGQSIEV